MALSVIPNMAESLLLIGASSSQHKAKGEGGHSRNVGSWQANYLRQRKNISSTHYQADWPWPLAILILNTHNRARKQKWGVVKTGIWPSAVAHTFNSNRNQELFYISLDYIALISKTSKDKKHWVDKYIWLYSFKFSFTELWYTSFKDFHI